MATLEILAKEEYDPDRLIIRLLESEVRRRIKSSGENCYDDPTGPLAWNREYSLLSWERHQELEPTQKVYYRQFREACREGRVDIVLKMFPQILSIIKHVDDKIERKILDTM